MANEKPIRRLITSPTDSKQLIGGLLYRPVAGTGASAVSKVAKAVNASAFNNIKSEVSGSKSTALALYVPTPLEEGVKLPPRVYSAAAIFAQAVGEEHPDAALVLRLADDRTYVVVLVDGIPNADFIDADNRIDESLRYTKTIYSNDTTRYPGLSVNIDWLTEKAESSHELKQIPMDPMVLLGGVATVLLLGGLAFGYTVYTKRKQEEAQRALNASLAAEDPRPKYLAALSMAKSTMAVNPRQWSEIFQKLATRHVTAPGWIRSQINCDGKFCTSKWIRKGGTHPELMNFLSGTDEVVEVASMKDTEIAVSRIEAPVLMSPGLDSYATETQFTKDNIQTFQDWKTGKFEPLFGQFSTWPVVPGLPQDFRPTQGMNAATLTMKIPGPLATEVLAQTPKEVSWTSMEIKFGATPIEKVSLKMTGVVYVSL